MAKTVFIQPIAAVVHSKDTSGLETYWEENFTLLTSCIDMPNYAAVKEHFLEGVALIGLDKAYKKRFREAEKKWSASA